MADGRTGQVFLEHYDVGMATTLGAELIDHERDGEIAKVYAVAISGVTGPDSYQGMVPVIMSDPEDAYEEYLLPQIVINQTDLTFAGERWHPGGWEYQTAAKTGQMIAGPNGQLMPTQVEKKWWTEPYDIQYDVHIRARLRLQAQRMFRHVGKYFWARGQVFLIDSEGDERGYYAFQESISNLSEIADVAERLQGHTISLRVEGELDFDEPFIARTSNKVEQNFGF